MVSIPECPICGHNQFKPVLTCKDYTTSQESFQIAACRRCDFHITNPRPHNENLARYYESPNYTSHNSAPGGVVEFLYRAAKGYTLPQKIKTVKNAAPPEARNLLDIGCGLGDFLIEAQSKGYAIHGVETSSKARSIAEEKTGIKINEYLSQISVNQDIITLWHVLEHIPALNETVETISNLLTSNGIAVIAVPNRQSYDAKIYREHWAAYDVPRHLWHFSKSDMLALASKHGLKIADIQPMKLDSFYVSLLSEKYKSNSTSSIKRMANAFINGLRSNFTARKLNNYSSLIYILKKK